MSFPELINLDKLSWSAAIDILIVSTSLGQEIAHLKGYLDRALL